jgi:hypothetical protein
MIRGWVRFGGSVNLGGIRHDRRMTLLSFRKPKPVSLSPTTVKGSTALEHLLTELALVLLPRGMTPKRFAALARSAFVQAASDMSKLRNGRVNHSRVAAQTGLTRADVKRLLKYNMSGSTNRGQTAVERVMDGWRADREFLNRGGSPGQLPISGARGSFARLVRKYGGDIPHRAVLDELRRIGGVIDVGGNVRLRESADLRQRHDFAFLSPVLPVLVDGLKIVSKKTPYALQSIQRLSLPVETDVDLAIVRDRCTSSAQALLEGLADSLRTQVARPPRGRPPAFSFTVTILLAENREKKIQRSGLQSRVRLRAKGSAWATNCPSSFSSTIRTCSLQFLNFRLEAAFEQRTSYESAYGPWSAPKVSVA